MLLLLPSKFTSCKIQDGCSRYFEIHFIGHNSVISAHIRTKFGTETKNDVPETDLGLYLQISLLCKSKYGGGRHFEIF